MKRNSVPANRALFVKILAGLLVAMLAAACGDAADAGSADGSSGSEGGGAELSLVAYSTPQKAYEEIIAAFQETEAGQGVTFSQSYGASGDQSRAVVSGLEADYA